MAADIRLQKSLGRKILIMGSNSKLPYILDGYLAFSRCGHLAEDGEGINVTVSCDENLDVRRYNRNHVTVKQERLDVLNRTDRLGELMRDGGFDSVIVLSKEGVSIEERDVNVLTAVLLMSEVTFSDSKGTRPQVIVELLDPRNLEIIGEYGISDVVVTTQLVSHLIAQCIRSPELKDLFDSLLNYGENNIYVKPSTRFFPEGLSLRFGDVVRALSAGGEIALGIVESGKVNLNPGFGHRCTVSKEMDVVVVSSAY